MKNKKTAYGVGTTMSLAGALVPQISDAGLVTVGGDGGMGTSTLTIVGNSNLGGLLINNIRRLTNNPRDYLWFDGTFTQPFGNAYRSAVSVANPSIPGGNGNFNHYFTFADGGGAVANALPGSSDNWVPGHFRVNGVNGGNRIFGWLHLGLPNTLGGDVTIHSFTYDNMATGTTPFTKPVGGFSVVPESSNVGLLALGAAGVLLRRRRRKAQASM